MNVCALQCVQVCVRACTHARILVSVSTFILPNQVDRWLARQCKQPEPGSPASHPHQSPASSMRPTAPTWGAGASGRDGDLSIEEEERLLGRIKDAWFQVDGALSLAAALKTASPRSVDGRPLTTDQEVAGGGDVATGGGGRDDKVGGSKSTPKTLRAGGSPDSPSAVKNDPAGTQRSTWWMGGGETKMGLRMEERGRGLTVTHVVPEGQAAQAGLSVVGRAGRCIYPCMIPSVCYPCIPVCVPLLPPPFLTLVSPPSSRSHPSVYMHRFGGEGCGARVEWLQGLDPQGLWGAV